MNQTPEITKKNLDLCRSELNLYGFEIFLCFLKLLERSFMKASDLHRSVNIRHTYAFVEILEEEREDEELTCG
jgi:sulfur relay (sulfurtransferase) DsrF/TusC family protein